MSCIGVDIIEISRIRKAIKQRGIIFLNRIYTPEELRLYGNFVPSLAVRFAGKEAVIKVLNLGQAGISLKEVEILSNENGQPFVQLYGSAKKRADELHIENLTISLSHCRNYAIAAVCD
jgi:holo-[acyl-carrier protein] synthase